MAKPRNPDLDRDIKKLFQSGVPAPHIAKQLGASLFKVYDSIKVQGLKSQPSSPRSF